MKIQWVREMLRRSRVMLTEASADLGPGNKGGGRDRLWGGGRGGGGTGSVFDRLEDVFGDLRRKILCSQFG